MTDELLTVQDTPGITTPLPWRVYRMNDYDWWIARTKEEAIASYQYETGTPIEELDDVDELPDDVLEILMFQDTDERDRLVRGSRRSFKAELALRIEQFAKMKAQGVEPKPELFATTET